MYKIYYIYMYKIYMCVSYDLKVSNEDFCCWGKILAIFLSNGSLFRAHGLHIPI